MYFTPPFKAEVSSFSLSLQMPLVFVFVYCRKLMFAHACASFFSNNIKKIISHSPSPPPPKFLQIAPQASCNSCLCTVQNVNSRSQTHSSVGARYHSAGKLEEKTGAGVKLEEGQKVDHTANTIEMVGQCNHGRADRHAVPVKDPLSLKHSAARRCTENKRHKPIAGGGG